MRELLKRICTLAGIQVTAEFRVHRLLQRNVFNTGYGKNALISYITRPFIKKMDFRHTNLLECFTAAEVLSGLGYNVDVVDCDVDQKVDFSKYDVIYGQGLMMEKAFYGNRNDQVRIMYCSGANPIFSDIQTILKVREFRDRNGQSILTSSRRLPNTLHAQVLLSDAVIVLGGKRTLETFRLFDRQGDRYHNLNGFYYDVKQLNLKKNFCEARRNFLWFGSTGALHKGLDILIEIFAEQSHCTLHVCGLNNVESDFRNYYENALRNKASIIDHGFVDMTSETFGQLMDTCGYVVLPSVSEGGAPSVLNVIANGGLVPIISRDCGLDIDDFGWVIDPPTRKSFQEAITQAQEISEEELRIKSSAVSDYVQKTYSYKQYKSNLERILESILTAN